MFEAIALERAHSTEDSLGSRKRKEAVMGMSIAAINVRTLLCVRKTLYPLIRDVRGRM